MTCMPEAVEMDVVVGLGAEGARRTNRHCEFAETLLVRRRQQTALLGRPCCGDRQDRNENQLSHVGTPFCPLPLYRKPCASAAALNRGRPGVMIRLASRSLCSK